ncbi:MAG: TetR family transcriptional regulator C-terminal domain-containing protein [Paracoccaceae bacterium]
MTEAAEATDTQPPRKASRDARRTQLIESTISTLAEKGYARTTLTDVALRAGLSHGLVNFHFKTKDNLLAETLVFLAEEYRTNWTSAMEAAGPHPAAQLHAMITADFADEMCTHERLSSWCAFWGEAQSRPLYQEHCGNNDLRHMQVMEALCAALLGQLHRIENAKRIARVIRTCSDGVWLEMINMTTPYDRAEGKRTMLCCLAAFFPEFFTPEGMRPLDGVQV